MTNRFVAPDWRSVYADLREEGNPPKSAFLVATGLWCVWPFRLIFGEVKSRPRLMTGHRCPHVDCDRDATHLIVEGYPFAMLFDSGAGLVCAKHAKAYERIGGANLGRVTDVAEAVLTRKAKGPRSTEGRRK